MLTLQHPRGIKKTKQPNPVVREEILITEKENIKIWSLVRWVFLRLSAGRGCSAQADVPFLNWRPKAEGQTEFFVTHISPERESDVKLSFYITTEKTAASASFGCRFAVVLLLSTASQPAVGTCRSRRWGELAFGGGLIASVQGVGHVCVTNGFCKLNLHLR